MASTHVPAEALGVESKRRHQSPSPQTAQPKRLSAALRQITMPAHLCVKVGQGSGLYCRHGMPTPGVVVVPRAAWGSRARRLAAAAESPWALCSAKALPKWPSPSGNVMTPRRLLPLRLAAASPPCAAVEVCPRRLPHGHTSCRMPLAAGSGRSQRDHRRMRRACRGEVISIRISPPLVR